MTGAILLHLLGLLVSLALGTAFCAMESAVLALNRARLLELFGSDATHGVSEQAIFRDTKETYFVSRLGLYGTLALAGFCGLRLAHAVLAQIVATTAGAMATPGGPAAAGAAGAAGLPGTLAASNTAASWALAFLPGAVTLLMVPPLYLFIVFAVPRLLMRPAPADPEGRLPLALRWFIRAVHPMARLSVVSSLLPLRGLLPHHQLTKSDLVSLVTDLETTEDVEEEEEEEKEREKEEERIAAALTAAGATPDAAAAGAAAAVGDMGHAGSPASAGGSGSADGGALREEDDEDETDEEELVYNILDLEHTLVRQVMEPINHVVAVRLDGATVESVLELARRTGYSRFPVYHERIVDLVGYLNVYDILHSNDPARPLDTYVTPAYYVPEFMRVNQLLREFLERNIDVAVVVDEHGGSSGWVTREDVLEEIVGEFAEESSEKRSSMIVEEGEGIYLVDASIDVEDLAEEVPLQFEEPQYDTLAGFILMTLGRVPEPGAVVTTDAATFTVEKVERNRVAQVRIRLHRPSDEEPAKA